MNYSLAVEIWRQDRVQIDHGSCHFTYSDLELKKNWKDGQKVVKPI